MTSEEADLAQEMTEVSAMDIVASNGCSEERAVDLDHVQSVADLQAILESLLFVSPEPMSVVRLTSVIGTVTKAEVEEALRGLGQVLEQEGRGVRLAEIAGGYRIVTKQEYASWIKRLEKTKTSRETLQVSPGVLGDNCLQATAGSRGNRRNSWGRSFPVSCAPCWNASWSESSGAKRFLDVQSCMGPPNSFWSTSA